MIYPWEAALFLVAFPASDMIVWSFFQYVQLGAILCVGSIVLYLRAVEEPPLRRLMAYTAICLSSLIYECYFPVATTLLMFQLFSRPKKPIAWPELWLGTFLAAFGLTLWIRFRSEPMFLGGNGLVYEFLLLLANITKNMLWLASATRYNIYELEGMDALGIHAGRIASVVAFSLMLTFAGFLWKKRKDFTTSQRNALFLTGLAAVAPYSLIAIGRMGQAGYASIQFRYAYVALPFLLALLFGLIPASFRRHTGYQLALGLLVAVNGISTLAHGLRCRDEMRPLRQLVERTRGAGNSSDQTVLLVDRTLLSRTLLPPISELGFIYNGIGCLEEWDLRTRASL
jgi:hypothetical protein